MAIINVRFRSQIFLLTIFCSSLVMTSGELYAQANIQSARSGNWSSPNTWSGGNVPKATDNAEIRSGHTVTIVGPNQVNNLQINSGGVLTDNGRPNIITGNLTINGTYSGSGEITFSGATTATINGTGNFTHDGPVVVSKNMIIASTANITKNSGDITMGAFTIENRGSITIGGNILGVAGSTWFNGTIGSTVTPSTLNIGGALLVNVAGTVLDASELGNTVNYFGGAQLVKLPVSGYQNLLISGESVKTIDGVGALLVNGNLTITSTLELGTTNRLIRLGGNFTNAGIFTQANGTVQLEGTAAQLINNANGLQTFNNLTINKTGGSITLSSNVIVTGTLNFNSSNTANVTTGIYSISVGTDLANTGTLTFAGTGYVVGSLTRWIASTDTNKTIDFPIGTSTQSRRASLFFNALSSGGALTVSFTTNFPGIIQPADKINDAGTDIYNIYRDGYWIISSSEPVTSSSFNLTVNTAGFNGFSSGIKRLIYRPTSANLWTVTGTHDASATTGNNVARTAMTPVTGQFGIGSDVNCAPPVTSSIIPSVSDICSGSTVQYQVSNTNGNSYSWTVTGGTIQSTLPYTSQISVLWGTGGIGKVSVFESNSCAGGELKTLDVNVNSIPPTFSVSPLVVPENGATPETYILNALPGYTYTWTITGASPTFPTSFSGTQLNISWGEEGTGTISVRGKYGSCTQSTERVLTVRKYKVIATVKSGNWGQEGSWDCNCVPKVGDNITINNLHSIKMNEDASINNLIINAGGTLDVSQKKLTITGDVLINGTMLGSEIITMSGSARQENEITIFPLLRGNGTFSNTGTVQITSSRNIPAGTTLSFEGSLSLNSGANIGNQGIVTVMKDITGSGTWTNSTANSSLNIAGSLLSNGTLLASAPGNTVAYIGASAQNVKTTNNYSNLIFSGAGIKTLPTLIQIGRVLTVDSPINPNGGTVEFNGTAVNNEITGSVIPQFHHLTNKSTTMLVVPSIMNISGNFTNSGVFNSNNGTIVFNGTALQTLAGGTVKFKNITLNSSANVRVSNSHELFGLLTLGTGATLDADGADGTASFTLKSTSDSPARDASVAALPSGAQVLGKVKVERYMSPEDRIYRYISSPTTNGSVSDLQNSGIPVTGNFTGATTKATCSTCTTNASMFMYNGSTGAYSQFPVVGGTNLDAMTPGRGYATFIRQDVIGLVPVTMTFNGPLNQGQINLPVQFNSATPTDSWSLVGNPYAAPIQWGGPGWNTSSIGSWIAVRDNGTGMHLYTEGNTVQDSETFNGVIATGQAFWVKVLGSTANLTVNETAKTTNVGAFYRSAEPDLLTISLKRENLTDRVYIQLKPDAETSLDIQDVIKRTNDNFNFASLLEGKKLAVNVMNSLSCGQSIPLDLSFVKNASGKFILNPVSNYSLQFNFKGQLKAYSVILRDNYLGTTREITNENEISFSITSDVKSMASDRFSIVFADRVPLTELKKTTVEVCDNSAAVIELVNMEAGMTYDLYQGSVSVGQIGEGDNTFTVSSELLAENETLFHIKATNICGTIYEMPDVLVVRKPLPNAKGIRGQVCGSGSVLLKASADQEVTGFNWYESAESTEALSLNTNSFQTPVISKAKTYYVAAVNLLGCEGERVQVEADVIQVSPLIINQDQAFTSNYESGNQWLLNGVVLPGAVNSTLIPVETGEYQVAVTTKGCTFVSEAKGFIIESTETGNSVELQAYPNPTSERIFIRVAVSEGYESATLFGSNGIPAGKVILTRNGNFATGEFDLSGKESGLYIIRISGNSKVVTRKISKL